MSVQIRDLAIGYATRRRHSTVAAGLNACARRGELTVLLGPNGAGKSTLIRTLCGLQPALAGRVFLDGTDLGLLSRDQRARRVAVVLTDRVDPGLLSAREVVGLGRIPHLGFGGRLRRRDADIVDWALAAVGAQQLAGRPAAELSDGERQRVLTARALAQQPDLLVLDEPTAFLDVSARAGLAGLLRKLARDQQLAVLMSTHDLELALRVADRVWLLDPAGTLVEAVGEELMLSGRIGELFDSDTLRFDPDIGVFTFGAENDGHRCARIDAPDPLRRALDRVLSREGWRTDGAAEIVLSATGPDAVTVRSGGHPGTAVALSELPALLRGLPVAPHRCVPEPQAAAMFAELSAISPYFAVGTGVAGPGEWRPVTQLYSDPALLAGVVDNVARCIAAPDRLVAVSTFQLGFAARLFSIGLGALAGHGVLPDLAPDQLMYAESQGRVRLHLPDPVVWTGEDLAARLLTGILDAHLAPLAAALRVLGPVSENLLRGNAATALLGAGRAFDRHHGAGPGPGWQLGRSLCADERLTGAVRFDETGTGYRRTGCCLYYRTPGGGLCGDCALDRKPPTRCKQREE